MLIRKRVIFPLLIGFVLIPSCKKFDDGPLISFRSEQNRLQGEWTLEYFVVNGEDSLQYLNTYFGGECNFTFYKRDEILGVNFFNINWGNSGNHYSVDGDQDGFNKNFLTILDFNEDTNSSYFPLAFLKDAHPNSTLTEWRTTRLKYDQAWFEMDVNGKHYELHLENIKKF